MLSSYSTALSGLNAMSTAIDIVGNNLANLNTTGYKADRADFKDLMAESLGGGNATTQVGLGTTAPITSKIFSQGTITQTQGSYDAAINGDGFFIVKNSSGQDLYTRDGSFQLDTNGNLVTSTGEAVQGWSGVNGVLNPSGALSNIQLPVGQNLPPQATTTMTLSGNLSSSAVAGSSTGTFSTQVQAVDSLGNTVPLNVAFTKDATVSNQWDYAVTSPNGTVTGGAGSIQFNGAGVMTSPTAPNGNIALGVSGLTDGASNLNVSWNLYDANGAPQFTQFSDAAAISANSQNGQPAAQLTGISLQNGGTIVATYSNGAQQQVVAQVALADVRNPESLVDVGNNNFSLGATTAAPVIGTAGTGGRGTIDGSSLEGSTVDIASEFSNLLTYERSYQANSRVVTVSDQLAQEAVNLVHS